MLLALLGTRALPGCVSGVSMCFLWAVIIELFHGLERIRMTGESTVSVVIS